MSNSVTSKFFFFTFFLCWIGILNSVLFAETRTFNVTATTSLAQIAASIQTQTDLSPTGTYHVIFSNYTNLGQFKLDAPTAKFDSIIFERDPSIESDEVISVAGTLFDLKSVSGTVTFKGLAFELANPTAVLIAGSDVSKQNKGLTMDSCFVHGDGLSSIFMSWDAGGTNNIDIKRSFFVVSNGVKTTKAFLSGATVGLKNNLFNFPGAVYTTSYGELKFLSNTINLTQFNFTGISPATYTINRNLTSYAPPSDAFNGIKMIVMRISGFDEFGSSLTYNTMLTGVGWQAFDNATPTRFEGAPTNSTISTIPGKTVNTTWDWDIPTETVVGKNNGPDSRKPNYNVYPNITSITDTSFGFSTTVRFESANFPRQFVPQFIAAIKVPSDTTNNTDLRFLKPVSGAIHFGAFRVDSISAQTDPIYGIPILLAQSGNTFIKQPNVGVVGGPTQSGPCLFKNSDLTARNFFLAFVGNTKRGTNVNPGAIFGNSNDSVVFKTIDTAGFTFPIQTSFASSDFALRYLNKGFSFQTNAAVNDSITFFVKNDGVKPFDTSKVFWQIASDTNELIKPNGINPPNSILSGKIKTAKILRAFLVEKLSAPRGDSIYKIPDGSFTSKSDSGYQILVDSIHSVSLDSFIITRFGNLSNGYRYHETGRGINDPLLLKLVRTSPDQILFEYKTLSTLVQLDSTLDSSKTFFSKSLQITDTGKIYFLGLKYNIVKDSSYTGAILGLTKLLNFTSSTSGMLKFEDVIGTVLHEKNFTKSDSVFGSCSFLGGKQFNGPNISPVQNWSMNFSTLKPKKLDKVEIWWSEGSTWTAFNNSVDTKLDSSTARDSLNLSLLNVPKNARYFAIVERLPSIDSIIKKITPIYTPGKPFVVTVTDNDVLGSAIDSYCFETKTLGLDGAFVVSGCAIKKIGQSSEPSVDVTVPSFFRTRFFYQGTEYGDPPFTQLNGTTWAPTSVLTLAIQTKPRKKIWHLIGFPYTAKLNASLEKGSDLDSGMTDTTAFMSIQTDKSGNQKFENMITADSAKPFLVGKACLLGSTVSRKISKPDTAKFLPLKPVRLVMDSAWNLIANPFPIAFSKSKIRSFPNPLGKFWALKAKAISATVTSAKQDSVADSTTYQWELADILLPFEGYLYKSNKNSDTLVFDWLTAPLPKLAARTEVFSLNLESNWGASAMYLSNNPQEENVGYFSTPNPRLEMHVGGAGGYLFKTLSRFDLISEPVTIVSTKTGQAHFSIPESNTINDDFHYRLVDLKTGNIYDELAARNLPVTAGSESFQFLAGSDANLNQMLAQFISTLPNQLILSQNYPNPVRGLTHFEFIWPAYKTQNQKAYFEIFDAMGKRVWRMDFNDLQMGRRVFSLDASHFKSGIYFYQLTALVDNKIIRKQNRMLVAP